MLTLTCALCHGGSARLFIQRFLRYRYDYLKSALDVLNKGNGAYLEAIKGIEEAYEDVQRYRDSYNSEAEKRFDKLISALPERIWIE